MGNVLPWVVLALAACAQDDVPPRGVSLVSPARQDASIRPFSTQQSAALFIGVRDFPEGNLGEIRYPVDDAVDLAYTMVFEKKVRLVPASRVVLALSNEPLKPQSKENLARLLKAGAIRTNATRETIATQLEQQAALTADNGLFILFVASHGFSSEGVNYVLSSTSRFQDETSSLSLSKFFDVAATRPRSLIFIDACRDRVPAGRRGPYYRAGSVTPLVETMTRIEGQVVFYAATPGGFAHEANGNGVFTRAIIDSLTHCDAGKSKGFITAETLGRRIDERVRGWIKRNRRVNVRKATQVVMDVETKEMPIAFCGPEPQPAGIKSVDRSLTISDEDGNDLWTRDISNKITAQRIIDLEDDQSREVIIGDARGTITVFAADGEHLWSQKTVLGLPIDDFTIDYLAGKSHKRHIVARSTAPDGTKSVISIFTADGTANGHYPHAGRVLAVVIDRLTASHDPKIIAADVSSVFMLDRKGERKWFSLLGRTIKSLGTIDIDNNRLVDIEVGTTTGKMYLNFTGNIIDSK